MDAMHVGGTRESSREGDTNTTSGDTSPTSEDREFFDQNFVLILVKDLLGLSMSMTRVGRDVARMNDDESLARDVEEVELVVLEVGLDLGSSLSAQGVHGDEYLRDTWSDLVKELKDIRDEWEAKTRMPTRGRR